MRRLYINIALMLFVISMCIVHTDNVSATAYTMPTNMKVGLAFNDSSGYLPLLSSATVTCKNNIKYSWEYNSKYLTVGTIDTLKILPGSSITSAVSRNVTSGLPNSNSTYVIVSKEYPFNGSYTIKLNKKFEDYSSCITYIDNMKSGGKYAFPYGYQDGFYICIGGFKSESAVTSAITAINNDNIMTYNLEVLSLAGEDLIATDSSKRILLAGDTTDCNLRLTYATSGENLVLNDVKYRGKLDFKMISSKGLQVVNVVPFERYLYSVVPTEIGSSSHAEALKAQAVIARNYAYNNLNRHKSAGFNVCASVHCQAYKGMSKEATSSTNAVKETAGQLVLYDGKPASCYYYSSSGGMTEDVRYVWGNTDIPYLKSVEDPYETNDTTNYTWSKTFTFAEVTTKLKNNGVNIGDVTGINIDSVTPAGRPYKITVLGTKGSKEYKNESCRTFLGLPSQLYQLTTDGGLFIINADNKNVDTEDTVYIETENGVQSTSKISGMKLITGDGNVADVPEISAPTQFIFTGKGWGHAVGLSQNGARAFAKQGYKYDEILKHYFAGTTVG